MAHSTTSVVLGGGGLAGIGWSVGVLAALEEHDALDIGSLSSVLGLSAGAAVAAMVLQAGSASTVFETMVRRSRRNPEMTPAVDIAEVFPAVMAIHADDAPVSVKAARFAQLSRISARVDPSTRRAAIASRLVSDEWPDAPFQVTAVRPDGTVVTFTEGSGVGLIDAVTASCAVPGLWPVVRIDGVDHIDGGTFSVTNAELAADADRVVVISPMPELPAYETPGRSAVLARAAVVEPSDRAREGFGPNPFDPEIRGVAAVLGYDDGLAAVARVVALS